MYAADTIQPAMGILTKPIGVVDRAVCQTIDFVEQKLPSIYLPPEMVRLKW